MKRNTVILFVGLTEIFIGLITIFVNFFALFVGYINKSANVFVFIAGAATISVFLGTGLLNRRRAAVQLLVYFSSVIVLSKLLIFAKIIYLPWTLESYIPDVYKNSISLAYHAFIIVYFSRPAVLDSLRK